jgi:hypothetical protein
MLQIRREQMDVFNRLSVEQFCRRTRRHLKQTFPSQTEEMGDERLDELIKSGIARAKRYGLEQERNVQVFLEFLVLYGLDLGTTPKTRWARSILADRNLDEVQKVRRLQDHATFLIREP